MPSWAGGPPEGTGGGNALLQDRESAGVLPEAIWMSGASAEAYEPEEYEVCISIRDPVAPLPALGLQFSPCSPWSSMTTQNQVGRSAAAASRRRRRTRSSNSSSVTWRPVGSSSTAWSASHARRASPQDCWSPMGGGPSPTGSSIQGCINASWTLALAGWGRGVARKRPDGGGGHAR
jgi:hypothetical protein